MLEVRSCASPEEKQKLFSSFAASDGTWIVSDLQSKWHLQKTLLAKSGAIEQTRILRATELWRKFAFQVRPELRLLSAELAQTLFWNWIQPLDLPWAKSPQAVPVVLTQMQMWMSVFSSPHFEEIMPQWFEANPESFVRWGHWFELCKRLWERCQSENLVMVSWLPAVLLGEDLSRLQWKGALTLDLGAQISQVEGQLIQELSRHFDVRVLFPEAPWTSLMPHTLRPYDLLCDKPYRGDERWQPSANECLEFGRYSTQLAEVKAAVSRVRAWLDAGVSPQKIAVIAPDIEEHWPALELYFREEGIPVCKPVTARLGSFLEMAQWLSTLRTASAKIRSPDLEVYLFGGHQPPRLGYDEFRVLFSHVYDGYDLKRALHLFEGRISPPADQELSVSDFLAWALGFWDSKAETTRLVSLLQILGAEVPVELQLKGPQWLSYFEGLLARRELSLKPAHEDGVWCVSLSSADWIEATHGVFLNLCESALRSLDRSPVSASEAQKIFTDTGFAMGTTDHQEHEFELLWFLQRQWTTLHLSFAETDFEGSVLTPSKIWMWAGFTNDALKHKAQVPLFTRWDEIQGLGPNSLARLRGWSETRREGVEFALNREASPLEFSSWRASQDVRLSASSLEKYWRCPFVFASERKLKLVDEPALDLDLDRRTRGRLLHALAEALSEEPLRFDWSESELNQLIEGVREREQVRIGDERMWAAIRSQHLRLARSFLEFEKQWRERFPQTKTVGRELHFECHWDLESAGPIAQTSPIILSGRLDRVDTDSHGRYALIDYKASANGLHNWKSWMEHNEIQLALYSLLLESGLTELPKGAVVAANYYVIRDGDRRKGFHRRDEDSELYSSEDRHANFLHDGNKAELFQALTDQIQKAVTSILNGELNPNPKNLQDCASCSWRPLCRAPHLN